MSIVQSAKAAIRAFLVWFGFIVVLFPAVGLLWMRMPIGGPIVLVALAAAFLSVFATAAFLDGTYSARRFGLYVLTFAVLAQLLPLIWGGIAIVLLPWTAFGSVTEEPGLILEIGATVLYLVLFTGTYAVPYILVYRRGYSQFGNWLGT